MVTATPATSERPTILVPADAGPPHLAGQSAVPPEPNIHPGVCISSVQSSFQATGFSAARRPATLKTYNFCLECYYAWPAEHALDTVEMSAPDLAGFFCVLF